MSNEKQQLESGLKLLGYEISSSQSDSLIRYLDVLEITNQSFNLTRISRPDYVSLHLLDSLTALIAISEKPVTRILDIGTGAGFPGVPLAAMLPGVQVSLLDSTAKKVMFAETTAHECGIMNCRGIHARAETLAKDPQHRGRYNVVVSRAVASFDRLIQLMLPLVSKGGQAIALKGAKAQEEIFGTEEIIRELGGDTPRIHTVILPGTEIERHIVIVDKL